MPERTRFAHHASDVKLVTRCDSAPASIAVEYFMVHEDDDMGAILRSIRCIRAARVLALVVGVTALAACAGRRTAPAGPLTMIIFSNESFVEATLYASTGSGPGYRMGTVLAGRTDTLAVPTSIENRGSVVFYADLLAHSASPRTPSISLRAGEWLAVRLPASLGALQVLPAP